MRGRTMRLIWFLLALLVFSTPGRVSGERMQVPAERAPAPPEAVPAPVLLIHGYGGSPGATWGGAIPIFEQAGYRRGETLFAVRLAGHEGPLGLLADAAAVREELDRIRQQTGAARVDLVGHSRGGLIARVLASGETAALVRRAVSIAAPHEGVLSDDAISAMLEAAGLPSALRAILPIPPDLEAGSLALATLRAREERFADRRSPALAIGSEWQPGVPAVLQGHDGAVPLASQLAWPGAATLTFRLGPSPEALAAGLDLMTLIRSSPHLLSQSDPEVIRAVISFLQASEVDPPLPACPSAGWPDLAGHWAESLVAPYLPEKLPYTVGPDGCRRFEPDRPMTRAEFVYGLVRMQGLAERFTRTPFADMPGHWAYGYVEAAREAGLVNGLAPDRFAPDQALTRAQATVLIARAIGLSPVSGAPRFADVAGSGHWAVGWIEAAAAQGMVRGDGGLFRPDQPITMAEGAAMLVRALGGY